MKDHRKQAADALNEAYQRSLEIANTARDFPKIGCVQHDCDECRSRADYKTLYEQMCERCDELDAKLAEYEQPEQEPVAWADPKDLSRKGHDLWVSTERVDHYTAPLYTAPQPQPEQEPVAEVLSLDEYGPQLLWFRHWINYSVGTKLYTAPQPRQWQGLTDEEIWKCLPPDPDNTEFARAIEQALREKNT